MSAATAPPWHPTSRPALRRLKLAAVRRLAPEVLQTAKTQRWPPDELLRTLLDAELAARDASNARARLRAAGFPVAKTLDEFEVADELRAPGDLRLPRLARVDPGAREPGPGRARRAPARSTCSSPSAMAAVEAGFRVRYFAAADLVETLYRGLADNSVGRVIEGLLRADLVIVDELGFAPLDDTGDPAAVPLRGRRLRAAQPRASPRHWPFESWGRFLPEHTTAVALLDRLLHHAVTVVTERRVASA